MLTICLEYPQIRKINAGDHACPGNVGMQRTESEPGQGNLMQSKSSLLRVLFTWPGKTTTTTTKKEHIRTGTETAHKEDGCYLSLMSLAWINT